MHPITNLVLSGIAALFAFTMYAVLPPQIYFSLWGAGLATMCLTYKDENADKTNETEQNKEKDQ
ncbi:hypothetical protein AB3R30_25580 [Leptolyngbyaceae cyanobacterium UHCC 1019]